MAIIPASRTYGVPQVSFRTAPKRPQRVIAFNTAIMLALVKTDRTHVAIDHDSKRREIRFVFITSGMYQRVKAFKLVSEGNTGRVLLAPKAQLDEAGIPYGRYAAEVSKKDSVVVVRYGAKPR